MSSLNSFLILPLADLIDPNLTKQHTKHNSFLYYTIAINKADIFIQLVSLQSFDLQDFDSEA